MYYGVVLSPCHGTVEKISIKGAERIYECDTLFLVKSDDGTLEMIQTNASGEVESVEVQEGDKVIPGMVLAYIKEDSFVTGSD